MTDPMGCAQLSPGLPSPEALQREEREEMEQGIGTLSFSTICSTIVYIIQILFPQRQARGPFTLKK